MPASLVRVAGHGASQHWVGLQIPVGGGLGLAASIYRVPRMCPGLCQALGWVGAEDFKAECGQGSPKELRPTLGVRNMHCVPRALHRWALKK